MAGQLDASSKLLGCEAQPAAPGCEVTVRRQIKTHRSLAPIIICQEALLGFAETGASIWEDPGAYRRPVAACRGVAGGLDLGRCATWAQSQGDKTRVQVELERRLRAFESKWE